MPATIYFKANRKHTLFSIEFLVSTHVTSALTTVAIRHVGAQTNALNREITVRKQA